MSPEEKQIEQLKSTLTAIVKWLEINQQDVFSRGLWDAINKSKESPSTPSPA